MGLKCSAHNTSVTYFPCSCRFNLCSLDSSIISVEFRHMCVISTQLQALIDICSRTCILIYCSITIDPCLGYFAIRGKCSLFCLQPLAPHRCDIGAYLQSINMFNDHNGEVEVIMYRLWEATIVHVHIGLRFDLWLDRFHTFNIHIVAVDSIVPECENVQCYAFVAVMNSSGTGYYTLVEALCQDDGSRNRPSNWMCAALEF